MANNLTCKHRWTKQEMGDLAVGLRPSGRTTNSIHRKKKRMGLTKERPPRPKWEASELAVLKDSALKGFSAFKMKEMGLLPQSTNAIQKMMCRMGLAKKRKIVKFPHEVLQRFRSFLVDNWEGRTPEELSTMWTRANARSPASRRRVVAELTRMKLKIPYGEVQRINNLRKKRGETEESRRVQGFEPLLPHRCNKSRKDQVHAKSIAERERHLDGHEGRGGVFRTIKKPPRMGRLVQARRE